jgi:hypothetical protein
MFLDDVDYLVEEFVFNLYYQFQCAHLHIMSSWHSSASDAPSIWLLMQLHHTGSQEESRVAVSEEQTWTDQQELQAQEVPEKEEQGEELPECVDHQPSTFERGKTRSILSLILYESNSLYMSYIYCCIKL